MKQVIDLSGTGWRLKGFVGAAWDYQKVYANDNDGCDGSGLDGSWYPASVPGTVQTDLLRLGMIEDPCFELNSRKAEWVSERDWVYQKRFRLGSDLAGRKVGLRFEGIDYSAHFFLNGRKLGEHTGMFTPVEFDISDFIKPGEDNILYVAIEAAPDEYPQIGYTSRVRTHKCRMAYGWDFSTRLVPLGIWKPVRLVVYDEASIEDLWVRSFLAESLGQATIRIVARVAATGRTGASTLDGVRLESRIKFSGQTISNKVVECSPEETTSRSELTIEHLIERPRLWWPNGMGDPNLYESEIILYDADGEVLDQRTDEFGIRKIEVIPNDNAPQNARAYTFVVNGKRTFVRGWNWVPADQLYGRDLSRKYKRLIELARSANVNLLRVWGGGLIEKEEFYRACDRNGIMVWQEFILSSSGLDNMPSSDPEYIEMLVREARGIIPLRRNHPSLVAWCGGNELMDENQIPITGDEPVIAALQTTVTELDPDRPFFPSSPTGPVFTLTRDIVKKHAEVHDVHGPWHYLGAHEHYYLYNSNKALFHSELGCPGATSTGSLRRFLEDASMWPPDNSNPSWHHHGGDWWDHRKQLEELFGELHEIDMFVKASQIIQAEGLRYAIASNMRRKFRCSGTIPWQFNEPWPNAVCTSAIDYYTVPKMAYYWVADCYSSVYLGASYEKLVWKPAETFSADLWINTGPGLPGGRYTYAYSITDLKGRSYVDNSGEVDLITCEECAYDIGPVEWQIPVAFEDVFLLHLQIWNEAQQVRNSTTYVFSSKETDPLQPLLQAPKTQLQINKIIREQTGRGSGSSIEQAYLMEVANTGKSPAMFVVLETPELCDEVFYKRNYVTILPGESEVFQFSIVPGEITSGKTKGVVGRPSLQVSGWNTTVLEYALEYNRAEK
ncbi:MAG: hypothetical protein HPY71_12745 [Firmicutes bacterium]|nr:hypothetical protein [Bacillota bacterium]